MYRKDRHLSMDIEKYKNDLEYHRNKLNEAFQNSDFEQIAAQANQIKELAYMISYCNKKDK
jgi:hypothetical protein